MIDVSLYKNPAGTEANLSLVEKAGAKKSIYCFMEGATKAAILWPTGVEPVKETILTLGWVTMLSPHEAPYPKTQLTTPAGKFISCMILAIIHAVTLVSSLGLH